MQATITVSNLTKQFGDHTVLRDISVSFSQGTTYAITGVSGTGKSTFMHLLSGLDEPTAGSVFCNHDDIASISPQHKAALLNTSIGHVFQNPYMIKELSVVENVMVPGLIGGMNEPDAHTRAMELLESVGLSHSVSSHPILLETGLLPGAHLMDENTVPELELRRYK